MQLFVIDRNPYEAARTLADCHVRKQILETAQILTAYWVNSGYERLDWMPRPQNYNHPVANAVNPENSGWVIDHFHGLLSQFHVRFQKPHAYDQVAVAFEICMINYMGENGSNIETLHRMFSGFTPEPGDIVSEYRQYYRWKAIQIKDFRYTGVNPPEWLEN